MDLIPILARTQAVLARVAGALLGGSASRGSALPPFAELERILVVRVDELGDNVLATAFLRELRRAAPRARITLVVQPGVAGVLRHVPYVDELLTYDVRCSRTLRPFVLPLRALWYGVRRLRPLRAQLAILPRWDADQVYATMLTRFSGAPVRVGYSHRVRSYKRRINAGFDALLTHVLDERGVMHEVDRSLALLRWMGVETVESAPELRWSVEDDAAVDQLLEPFAHLDDRRLVALCPSFGHSMLKQWPPERFATLARRLDARGDVRVVLVGSAADTALAAPAVDALGGRAIDLTGRTTLTQLSSLLSRCALLVGADTGVMHVGAAVGIPVIGVMGPTNVVRFAPWQGDVVTLDLPCSPIHRMPEEDRCPSCVLGSPRCMLDLPAELVYEAVARRLDAPTGGSPASGSLERARA